MSTDTDVDTPVEEIDRSRRTGKRPYSERGKKIELDEREIIFVEVYCTNGFKTRNAALEAGYPSASQGTNVRQRPHVIQAIYERLRFENVAAPELIERVGQIARADIKHYLRKQKVLYKRGPVLHADSGLISEKIEEGEEVVVDLVKAMEEDATYPIKSIEFHRDGTPKRIVLEDRLEAIKLLGAAYGLFGTQHAGDDGGRSWFERARDMGIDPRTALDEMIRIASEWKVELPKELIEGQFSDASAH